MTIWNFLCWQFGQKPQQAFTCKCLLNVCHMLILIFISSEKKAAHSQNTKKWYVFHLFNESNNRNNLNYNLFPFCISPQPNQNEYFILKNSIASDLATVFNRIHSHTFWPIPSFCIILFYFHSTDFSLNVYKCASAFLRIFALNYLPLNLLNLHSSIEVLRHHWQIRISMWPVCVCVSTRINVWEMDDEWEMWKMHACVTSPKTKRDIPLTSCILIGSNCGHIYITKRVHNLL